MNASTALLNSIRAILAQVPPLDFGNRRVLLGNLVFLFHTMRASEDLLAVAGGLASGELYDYYTEHLEEERGHAESLRADLRSAGIEATETAIPREAVELVGSQFYLIRYLHPCALLGYLVLAECFPMSMDLVEQLEAEYGPELIRTLRHHAKHDVDHGAAVLELIDSLPAGRQHIVIESGTQAATYFAKAMQLLAHQTSEALNG